MPPTRHACTRGEALATWTPTGDPDSWPAQWATEGLALAKEAHSGLQLLSDIGPDEDKRNAHRWSIAQPPDYDARARPLIRQQFASGGYRLAAVLKAIWPINLQMEVRLLGGSQAINSTIAPFTTRSLGFLARAASRSLEISSTLCSRSLRSLMFSFRSRPTTSLVSSSDSKQAAGASSS